MSEGPDEARPQEWVDPRFRGVAATFATFRVERLPGKRPRRVCPHGSGVTVMVDPETGGFRNVACATCSTHET